MHMQYVFDLEYNMSTKVLDNFKIVIAICAFWFVFTKILENRESFYIYILFLG